MEYKYFETPEVKMTGDGQGFIAGYASTFDNFDSVGERVVRGAFAQSLPEFLKDGFIAVGHDWSGLPIATPVEAVEDERGLFVRGEFHSTRDAQDARTVIRERLDRGKGVKLSIGYEVEADEYTKEGRLLKQLKLFEWSYVAVPANSMAAVTDAKHRGLPLVEHTETVLAAVEAWKTRIRGLQDVRAKEGRVLSDANRKRIQSIAETLTSMVDELSAILAATEPKADPKALQTELLRFQRTLAQLNGVAL